MKNFTFFFLLLLSFHGFSQDKFYMSVGTSETDQAYSVIQSKDGSYIATGYTANKNYLYSLDCYIVKLDEQGNLIWTKALETADYDHSQKIIKTNDDGFIISGAINDKAALCKFDKNANLEWVKQYNQSTKFRDSYAKTVLQTKDNGYLLPLSVIQDTEYSTYYAYLVKTDAAGNIQWAKRYFTDLSTPGIGDVKSTLDGNYIVATFGGDIVKINSVGEVLWSKKFVSGFYTIVPTSDSGFVLGGHHAMLKIDNNGNLVWSKNLITDDGSDFSIWNAIETDGHDYIFVGPAFGHFNGFIKLNSSGVLQWTKKIEEKGSKALYDLIETRDRGYLAVGNQNEAAGFIKFDSSFNTCVATYKFGKIENFGKLDTSEISVTTGDIVVNTETVEITSAGIANFECGLLPLNILSFSVKKQTGETVLNWSTLNEINTDRFEIQRSSNSRDFITIGTVRSLNNGKQKNDYSFTDAQPLKATNYYRLKMIDKDGKFTYSAIKNVNNSSSFDVTLYPNPVHQNLTLSFNAEKAMDVQIEIVNAEGKKVYAKKLQLPYGASAQNINVVEFGAGNYFIKCITADGQMGLKFVKQ